MPKPDISQLLQAADKQYGFPAGTMASLMQQETGGNQKYLNDPAAYHYDLNAEGKRIAGHTGKVSTAFGPFGILESTAANPGYGVAPLKDKSLEEQVRFAAEYLGARSKAGGGLASGLAGYGEGSKYATQVLARVGDKSAPVVSPVVAVAVAERPLPEAVPTPQQAGPTQYAAAPPAQVVADQAPDPIPVPTFAFNSPVAPMRELTALMNNNVVPNFKAFGKWGKA